MTQTLDNPQLRQRGRASVDFLVAMLSATGSLRETVEEDIGRAAPDPDALPDDLDERQKEMAARLSDSQAFATQQLMGDWHGRNHGRIAAQAFEEVRTDLDPFLKSLEQGPATLERNPGLTKPSYWEGVNFHRTSGGWDRHPYQGFVHGEIVHRKIVAKFFPGGIFEQRRAVAEMAPKESYTRILEMGTSSGHYTTALQQAYPEAEIHGVELSVEMLEHAWRTANAHGWAWRLYQRAAEDTGFADDSFDLVTSYILLHEIPETAIRAVFAEAFRVSKPGGDLLMSDVTRFADLDKLSVWKADRRASTGGEPHWRESASLDLAAIAREAGFVDVTAEGIYPHVIRGRKR